MYVCMYVPQKRKSLLNLVSVVGHENLAREFKPIRNGRAQNNDRSTDNVRPDRGLDWSNSRLAGHFDRSVLDTNIL